MNTTPIRPAPFAAHAVSPAGRVLLDGSDLPGRWQRGERFVVLEAGFGLGCHFLATWAAWRASRPRDTSLVFVAIEPAPPTREALAGVRRERALAPLAAELVRQWPPLTCNLHRLDFDEGAVRLLLAFGDVAAWLPQLSADVDAFFLGGAMSGVDPAPWDRRLFKAMARVASPGATVAALASAGAVRDGLRSAGFEIRPAPGDGHALTLARFAPPFLPPRMPRRCAARPAAGRSSIEPIVVVGAGLAGCALAAALADDGRHTLLLDRRDGIASEGSGNAAGLLHGIVHAVDSRHARFYRAAALAAQVSVRRAIGAQGVAGRLGGLLRLDRRAEGRAGMQAVIDALGLPADYVQALDAERASAMAGVRLATSAWYYPQGGWVDPRGLAQSFLESRPSFIERRGGVDVAGLQRHADRWALLDAQGRTIVESTVVALANAGGALDLLGKPEWPIASTRGQITAMRVETAREASFPRLPVAGAGYVLPPIDGRVWFGATSQRGDDDLSVRVADHRENVQRLAALLGSEPVVEFDLLCGRTARRWVSDDRLPVIGAVPCPSGDGGVRRDQPRLVPREPGLFVCTALGSRGIAASVLGAQIVASAIVGAPAPVEADLLDAVDPARFAVRAFRRGPRAPGPSSGPAQPPVGPMAGSTGA